MVTFRTQMELFHSFLQFAVHFECRWCEASPAGWHSFIQPNKIMFLMKLEDGRATTQTRHSLHDRTDAFSNEKCKILHSCRHNCPCSYALCRDDVCGTASETSWIRNLGNKLRWVVRFMTPLTFGTYWTGGLGEPRCRSAQDDERKSKFPYR
jgi:hypothetical protein